MFNTRQEFYEFGQSRGYSQEEIQEKERQYFDRGFSYRKENVIPFEPHKIVNTPMPNYTIVDETQASQQLKPNFEENHNKGVVHMYYDAKNQTPAQEVLDGSSRVVNEMRIRSDFDIPNDKPIQYFSVLEELKKQHPVAEDDMYYDSSTPATLSSLQSQLKGVFPDEEPSPDTFIEPEFAMRDLFFLSGERAFMRDAIEGSLDIDYDEAGNPIKGSGGVVGSTRYGTYNVGLSQRIMQNGIEGDREEIQKLINNDKIIREKIGGAYDYSDYDYIFSRRGFMTALQSAGMMAENAILGIGGTAATPFAGGAGGAVAVITYNQQVGAGDMLLDYLYDEDVASMSDEEFEKAVQISNVIGVPFALIEQSMNIPMIKATGVGTTILRPLKRKIIKKMMKKPELIKRVTTGGVDAMYRIAVETFVEESGQEFVQEIGRQGMEDIDLEKSLFGNVREILEDADYEKATTQAIDASIQALPAVIVMGGATTSIQATFDKNYLKEFTRDIEDARAGDELSVYRTAATKKLTNMGMPLELAEDLVDQAVYAETMQEVRDVIAKTQSALLEFNESFERVGLKTLTDQDWNSFGKFMSETQLDEFIQMFPEIKDDFKAGVQGDVDARNRYNAFVKNNQDAQYLDFLVQQNQQSGQQQAPRTLSDKQKDEILNTNKHDAKFEERRLEGETLEETKLRYVYGIENMGDPFIRERIGNVRKGLLRLMPNLQILVAENDNQYLELTKLEKPSAGVYQQGRIVLNLERVNKTTVAHEAFHALLDHYVSDKTFAGVINRIVDNVVKVADDSLIKRIELHRAKYSDYTEIDQKEEMVAELAGILSDSYNQLPSARSGIRGLNDRLLSLVGIKTKSMADQEVIDMFNSVVKGFSKGVTITEGQVSPVLGDVNLETFKRQLEQRATTPKTVSEFLETIFGEPTSFLDTELVRINDKPVFLREVINSFADSDSQQFTYKELQQIAKALPFFNLRRNTTRQQLEEGIEDYGRNLENETIPVNSNYFDDNKFKDFIDKNEDELLDHYGDDYDYSYEGAYFYHLLDTADFVGKRKAEQTATINLEETQQQDIGGKEQRVDLDNEGKSVKPVKGKEPKKTVKAYKLFRLGKDNKLYPLFVRANEVIPEGEWIEAQMGTLTKDGRIKAERGLKTVAARGGFHAGDYVSATHIGGKGIVGNKKKNNQANYRKPDQVWAEVEFADDVDWQTEANNRATKNKDGSVNVRTAHITDQVPSGGYYRYKTNPNMKGNWLIGGDMKVVKRLSLEERKQIMSETGISDLPELSELIEQENLSFNDLSKTAQSDLKQSNPDLYEEMSQNPDREMGGKEQRDTDPDDLLDLLREIQGVGQSGQSYLNQTIDDYNEMRQKWNLEAFDPSMVMGFEEQTAEAVKQFGIVEDSNHPDFGNFNVDYFMQSVMDLIYELKDGQKLPSLNSTEQAAVTLAISILDKRATQLTKEIEVADGEGRVNYTSRLINERGNVVTQIERLSNLLIRARSDAARLLGSHRNNLREDYTLANILYRVAKITGTTETSEANVEYFSTRANELNEIEERKERLDTQLDSEYDEYYDEQVDDYFDYTYNTPAPEGILARARKAVKEITTRAGKFFGKFGGKEQRISDARSSGGVLDTDNYVDRPEVLAARLAELFINDDVRDGKPLDKDSVLRRVKRVLEEDGHEFSMRDIKKAIAENTLKQYDLRKQYVAFLSLLKISATLEEDLSQAASKIFDADKKVRANGEDAIAMEATLDKLVAHFDALLNTVNTIYDKRMVKELRKRIETLRQLADDITAPKISQKRKSKIVTKAQEELKLLQAKQRTKKRIAELQKIIDEGSYDAILLKRQKQASKYDQEMLDLMGRERRLKNEINKKIAMLEAQQENRLKRLLRDSMVLPRTLKAMADMSAAFNQAIMYLGKDPVGWMKTFTRGFGVFFNAKYADKMDGLTRALARDYGLDNFGIDLTSTEGQINQKEEVFLTEFFNLPIIKQTIGKLIKDPSERHYVNFLNRMRVDMCVGFMKRHPNATTQEIMEWVEFVNLASGRGKIGKKFDNALPYLGTVFFAPRLTASRFKLPYYSIGKIAKNIGKGRGVATEIATTWIGFGTTYGVMALLAVLNGWKIEDDPEESDYLKLRKDKLVLNPLGNFQQVARVHHLLLKEGEAAVKGEEGGFSIKPMSRMLKWKLNPIFSFASEVGMNKDWVTGEELKDNQPLFGFDTRDIPVLSDSRYRAFVYNTIPISVEGWAEGLDKQQEAGEIYSQLVPDFFGIGSSYYEKQKPKSKRKSRRSSNLLP